MGCFHDAVRVQNPPTQLVRDVFVETGTSVGDSFGQALALPFRELYTIEFNAEVHQKALARHREVLDLKCPCPCRFSRTARLVHGSSPEMLPRILDGQKDTTIYLDAHSVDPSLPGHCDARYGQCPLMLELDAIAKVQWVQRPLIIVDDASMLLPNFWDRAGVSERWDRKQWPTIADVMGVMGPQGYSCALLNDQWWLW